MYYTLYLSRGTMFFRPGVEQKICPKELLKLLKPFERYTALQLINQPGGGAASPVGWGVACENGMETGYISSCVHNQKTNKS